MSAPPRAPRDAYIQPCRMMADLDRQEAIGTFHISVIILVYQRHSRKLCGCLRRSSACARVFRRLPASLVLLS